MSNTEELAKIVDRLDAAADKVEAVALLAAEDRVQISRLIVLVQRLTQGMTRLESGAAVVAQDLADSIERADGAPAEVPGAGADAALRSGEGA